MTHQSEQELECLTISPQEFKDLYVQQGQDIEVTSFKDISGFSVIRNYSKDTEFFQDGNVMLIRVYLDGDFVCGGVEMVGGKQGDDRYYLVDTNKYYKKTTGFSFYAEEEFVFDSVSKKILNNKKGKSFSVNEFVDVLVKNHLSDKLFLKRKINLIVHFLLKFIFWLSGRKYDEVKIFFRASDVSMQSTNGASKEEIEPFFKYFYISKNILGALSIFTIIMLFVLRYFNIIKEDSFTISNPIFVFSFFLFLFISEKLTFILNEKMLEFFDKDKKENFISHMYRYQYKNSFNLKF